jgi:signal transduction histidine kinase
MASTMPSAPARHGSAARDVRPPPARLRPLGDLEVFLAGAAHDLRDPLQTALGHLDLLEMRLDPGDPAVQQSLADARGALLRMRTSLEDMLAYARSTQPADSEAIDLDAVVRTVLQDLKAPLDAAGAAVHVGPLPQARGHAPHVARIVQNLLSNAAKYRGARPPAIRISGAVAGGRVRLDVADNGRGLAPDELARLFRPFVRLPSSRGVAGTGLGLATSARLAESMGGRLWAESAVGEGSTFHLDLPAA